MKDAHGFEFVAGGYVTVRPAFQGAKRSNAWVLEVQEERAILRLQDRQGRFLTVPAATCTVAKPTAQAKAERERIRATMHTISEAAHRGADKRRTGG